MVKCKHWRSCGLPDHGDCAINFRTRPEITFCIGQCTRYHQEGLLPRQRSKGVVDKGVEFLKSQARMLTEGKVPEAVAQHRLSICTGKNKEDQEVDPPCMHYAGDKKERGDGICKSCGCPDWPLAEMKNKVYYSIGCPVGRFAVMPGRRKKDANNSGARPQPEAKEGQGSGPADPSDEGGWPPSERI